MVLWNTIHSVKGTYHTSICLQISPLGIKFKFRISFTNVDGFVKSPFCPIFVIPESGNPGFPVKTGIQIHIFLVPCFRRGDGFSEFCKNLTLLLKAPPGKVEVGWRHHLHRGFSAWLFL